MDSDERSRAAGLLFWYWLDCIGLIGTSSDDDVGGLHRRLNFILPALVFSPSSTDDSFRYALQCAYPAPVAT
jgi:hypothetical protein